MKEIKEHYNSKLPRYFGAIAITFGRHIFYTSPKGSAPEWLRRHEHVHVEQYKSYGIFRFLMIYFYWYLRGRLSGLSHYRAYYEIPFEVEARKAERA